MQHRFLFVCALIVSAGCQRSERREEQTLPVLPAPAPAPSSGAETSPPYPPRSMDPPLQAEDRVNTSGRDDGLAVGIDESAEHEMARRGELAPPGETLGDRAITLRIREALMEDGSFSGSAKSIGIESVNGVVTLRGTVRNKQERSQLMTLASAVPGVQRVDNQLQLR